MDLIFDEIIGHELYHKTKVKAVIGDKVKCMDDELIEFYEDVEWAVNEYDDIIILKNKESESELKTLKELLSIENKKELLESDNCNLLGYESLAPEDIKFLTEQVNWKLEVAIRNGFFTSYVAVCNNKCFGVYSFSL